MRAPHSTLPARVLAVALLFAAAGCETLDAVGEQIEEDGPAPARAVEPEPPPLPPRPLETIARLELAGSDGNGMLELLLAHGDELARVRAATALGRIDAPDPGPATRASGATAALCAALDDPSPDVREAAAFAIGMRGDPAASEALLEHWMDRNSAVRARIVEAASRIDDPRLHGEVITAIADPALDVRIEAVLGPHRWPAPTTAHLHDELLIARARKAGTNPELVWRILFTLQRRACQRALPLYLAHVDNEDPRARLFAIKGIAKVPTSELHATRTKTLATLRDRLADPDWRVAAEAATALGAHPDASSVDALTEAALKHSSPHVRSQALLSFGAFADEKEHALTCLRRAQGDPAAVAAAAIEAECRLLREAGGPTTGYIDSDDPLRRAGLARGLRYLPADEAVPLLVRLSYDEDKSVAWFAVMSLGAHVGKARARLHELCTSTDNGLRLAAVSALREDPSPTDVPFLRQAYETSTGDISEEVAFNALKTAAAIPGDASLELVRHGLAHEASYVRQVARELLRERTPKAVPPLPVARPSDVAPSANGTRKYRIAEVVTNRGTMTFELFPDEAPRHVENFVRLAESGAYDGLGFHRVVPDFVIQGGDHRGDGNGARPWNRVALRREFTPRKYVRGSLGMPRNEDPDSGGSQIFVTHRETPHLDGRYTLFGQLTGGFDVLDAILVGDVIQRVALR